MATGVPDFTEIHTLFGKAERRLKQIEKLTQTIAIPAINELRYAGFHILEASTNGWSLDELTRAKNHCNRAFFDAVEAGVLHLLKRIEKFMDDYRMSPHVIEVLPNYPTLLARVDAIKDILVEHHVNNGSGDAHQCEDIIAGQLDPYLDELKQTLGVLEAARSQINVKDEQAKLKEEQAKLKEEQAKLKAAQDLRKWIIHMSLIALGVVVAIVFGLKRSQPAQSVAPGTATHSSR